MAPVLSARPTSEPIKLVPVVAASRERPAVSSVLSKPPRDLSSVVVNEMVRSVAVPEQVESEVS